MTEPKLLGSNIVLIGKKPSIVYVLGVILQFGSGEREVHIRARGRTISRAVDVAEIVRRRFIKDAKIKSIEIGTDEIENEDKTKINVSTINITISK